MPLIALDNSSWINPLAKGFVLVWGLTIIPSLSSSDTFNAHELFGTGAGVVMADPEFSYLRYHQVIQAGDIDGDGNKDVVVLADASDFTYPSANVTRGPLGDPDGTVYVGSDLAWYMNDGFDHFFPQPITVWDGGAEKAPLIYNGKTMQVADLDADGDDDIVVWCNTDNSAASYAVGGGYVAWFENRRVNLLGLGEFFPDGRPYFLQHNLLRMEDGDFSVGAVTYSVAYPRQGTIADMDGDGKLDIVVYPRGAGTVNLYYFRNTGASGAAMYDRAVGNVNPFPLTVGGFFREAGAIAVVVSDVDNDGDKDVVLGEAGGVATDREVILLRKEAGGTYTKEVIVSNFNVRFSKGVAVADLFGNDCKEIVAGGKFAPGFGYNSPLTVFSASDPGCTVWTPTVLPNAVTFNHIWDIRLADMNNDGLLDVLAYWPNDSGSPATVTPSGRRSVAPVWINDGSNPATWRTFYLEENQEPPGAETDNGGGLAVEDFDKDGDLDVMRAHVETNLTYFENTWNTERFFQIDSVAEKNGMKQRLTTLLSTKPDRTGGPVIGQRVESQ